MKTKAYKYLFFDWDHTLWDFTANSRAVLKILYAEFELEKRGIGYLDFQKEVEKHNLKFWQRLRKGQASREELRWKRFWHALQDFHVIDTPLSKQMSERYLELLPIQTRLLPNTREIIDYCQQKGYHLHLLTNGFEPNQKKKLAACGMENTFESMVSSQSCGEMKPSPEIFKFALRTAGATKENSLMIGDSIEVDIVGAQKFGMDQVFFNPEQLPHLEQPTYEITDLLELKEIL